MITIFNRKQLIVTYDMTIQAKIRDVLSAYKIDYVVNPVMFSSRMYTQPEYKIYVKKKDYEHACYLIRDVFR